MYKSLFVVIFCCICFFQGCGSNENKKDSHRESNQSANINERNFIDIIPLADGGAYACDGINGTIWYLRGGEAVKIKEVNQLSSQQTSLLKTQRERALWALYQNERAKNKSTEAGDDLLTDNSSSDEQ